MNKEAKQMERITDQGSVEKQLNPFQKLTLPKQDICVFRRFVIGDKCWIDNQSDTNQGQNDAGAIFQINAASVEDQGHDGDAYHNAGNGERSVISWWWRDGRKGVDS